MEDVFMTRKPTYEELEQRVTELEKEVDKSKTAEDKRASKAEELDPSYVESENPYLIDGKYSIKDLIDLEFLRSIFEKFSEATGFTTGLISFPDMELPVSTGWRDICTKFHRAVPESEKHCKESNRFLTSQLKELKELNIRACKNNLIDGATPVIIKGKHVASLATGQILFEKPDINLFKKQAERYGYDVDAYLDALQKVPIVTEAQFKSALSFLSEMAVMIGELGLNNLKMEVSTRELKKEVDERKRAEEALQESKEEYSLLAKNLPGFVCKGYKDWSVDFFDNKIEALIGYAVDEFNSKRMRWIDIIVEKDLEAARESFIQALKSDRSYVREYRIRSKAGDIYWIQERGHIVCDSKDEIDHVSCVFYDVSGRKRAEKVLRQSEEKYRNLYDIAPLAFVVWNRDCEITDWNKHAEIVFGWSREEALGKNFFDLIVPESAEARVKDVVDTLFKGEMKHSINENITKSGELILCEWNNSILYDNEGNVSGAISLGLDITDRKKAEDQLQESENRYRSLYRESKQREQLYESLLKSTPDAVSIYNLDGEITYTNPAFNHIFGLTMEDIKAKRFPFIPENEKERTIAGIKKVIKGEPVSGFETRRLTKDGRLLDITLSSFCYNDHEGNKAGVVVFLRDLTETKQTERQLQQAQRMEAIGTLAGGIAHDFNNLLMGIQGRSSLMLINKDSSHPEHGHLKGIEDHVKSASDLTSQLLAFARGGKYEVTPTDLNKLVENQSRMFGRTKKEITIHGKYEKNLWSAEVDRGQIEQVLLNLYVNAWQSMPGGGNLYIQTENVTLDENYTKPFEARPGKYVKISVADTGVGMDEKIRQRIFDPFFTTREIGRGTGLGLASAYGIIKNHNGFITVYSQKGKGTTFSIYLPGSDKEVINKVALSKGLVQGAETVLLVDDEEMIIDIGQQFLEKLGYKVLIAKGGRQAIEFYDANKDEIDLVILDMIMPDMGGGEAYDKLKKINPKVRVLLSSGYSITGQATEIMNRGCNGFIQKPFNMKDLSLKLREILNDN